MKTVKKYAQIQKIDGVKYEFQPKDLFCEGCWDLAGMALEEASCFGRASVKELSKGHAMSVTRKS